MATNRTEPLEAEDEAELTPEEIAEDQEFHGGALIAEALRRVYEADTVGTLARQHSEAVAQAANGERDKARDPDYVTPDGEKLCGRSALLDYRLHMTTTAALLIQAAKVAADVGPAWIARDSSMMAAWQGGFAAVYDLMPPPRP